MAPVFVLTVWVHNSNFGIHIDKLIKMLSSVLLLSMPGGTEWIIIVIAILVLFGGRKIPEFMRGIGRGIREFNDAKTNVKKEIEDGISDKDKQQVSS